MIRPYAVGDRAAVLELNAANVPEVGEMDEAKLALFERMAPVFRVVELDGAVVGVLIGLTEESTDYRSPNFRWFCDRHQSFAYVDRIALAPEARGQGLGPALYDEFVEWARASGRPVVCAEVNTLPPNPRSLRFHELYGFVEVGRCNPYGPNEEVAMLDFSLNG